MSEVEADEEDVIIRNYRTSDYEETLGILRTLHDKYDIGLIEEKWRKSSGLRQFKPNLKRITLIAESKSTGEVIGMGMLEAVKNTLGQYVGYLDNWATKEKYIGKQVGKILAERAIQLLKSWGCESIRINLAYGAPEKLLKIFAKTGFKPLFIVLEKKFNTQPDTKSEE
ncbi:MAG: GNAT family N-acetyltransferase [Promethearchaeota archaeon]|nr:MAG: GNAT family N-acetyltransferase [Candidatus Lokiarchaeota archaeon]